MVLHSHPPLAPEAQIHQSDIQSRLPLAELRKLIHLPIFGLVWQLADRLASAALAGKADADQRIQQT